MVKKRPNSKAGTDTHKREPNAGSSAFNQGAEQDPDYDKGTKVSDAEKLSGLKPDSNVAKKKRKIDAQNKIKKGEK